MNDIVTPGGGRTADDAASQRRRALLGVKLRALVGEHLGQQVEPIDVPSFPPGAGLLVGDEAWVLLDDQPARRLGSALAWALRRNAAAVHVIAEVDTDVLARRAAAFSLPVMIWRTFDRSLDPVVAEPVPRPAQASAAHLELRELIAAGGATPLVEHGVVTGEVRGLEVCRVVDDPDRPGFGRLDVGVGANDREAFRLLHGETPTVESLARVVEAVRPHRHPGAPRHPFNRMGAERFVRWRVEDDPGVVGLRSAAPSEPPVPRSSAVDPVPCVALATDPDGAHVLVVCSSGVDLDLIPYAADARLAAESAGPGVDRTLVVTPSRDQMSVTREVAALLDQPVELVSLD